MPATQCPDCGALNGERDSKCYMCGAALPRAAAPATGPAFGAPPAGTGSVGTGSVSPGGSTSRPGTGGIERERPSSGVYTPPSQALPRDKPPRCPACGALNLRTATHCRACGADLAEAVAMGGAGGGASGHEPPWEQRSGFLDLQALGATITGVLLRPGQTLGQLDVTGSFGAPLSFALITTTVTSSLLALLMVAGVGEYWNLGPGDLDGSPELMWEDDGFEDYGAVGRHHPRQLAGRADRVPLAATAVPSATGGTRLAGVGALSGSPLRLAQHDEDAAGDSWEGWDEDAADEDWDDDGEGEWDGDPGYPGSMPMGGAPGANPLGFLAGPMALLLVPFVVIGMMMSSFVSSGLFHLGLLIVGSAESYRATYRVVTYSVGATFPLLLIPLLGERIQGIWNLWAICAGYAALQNISFWRSLAGFVLGIVIPIVLVIALVISLM